MTAKRDIDLKATLRSEHLERLKDLLAIKKRTVGRARWSKLVTVYFDTPDLQLRRLGLSLRVRKSGRAYVQCVKQVHNKVGGVLVRTQCEDPVPSQDPVISVVEDKALRRQLRRVGVEHLQPVFRTHVQRSSQTLKFDDGSTVSLDIDVGAIVAGDICEPTYEFELELKSGAPDQLFDLACEIRKDVPFRLATLSKSSRGYALLTQDDPQAQKYVRLNLSKDHTVEQALAELVQHCLDYLRAGEAVVLKTDNAEGVHQMRVALRRLRAALRLFKKSLAEDQYGWAVAEAKWLTAELSAARAWDVFADEFVAPVARLYGAQHGFDALIAAVDRARQQSRQRARDAIGTCRYTQFLLRLNAWLASQTCRDQPVVQATTRHLESIGEQCVKWLHKRDRNVRKRGRDIENLPEEALHELRLVVKKQRYAVDFFAGLYPKKPTKLYRKHLAALQDRLGLLNDVAVADTLLRELAETNGDQRPPDWAFAGGLTLGWHDHAAIAARRSLVKDMAAFLRSEPFGHGHETFAA
ncbi:MAG: triphosphatase [Gammaproteobacteria bacterium]|jgi:triphosphatase